ncbi:MAG: alpha/beta hydrolase [Candidatus Brocadiia bacterium]
MAYLLIFILAYVVWCVFLYSWQDRLVWPAELSQAQSARPKNAEAISLPLPGGGAVEAWFFAAKPDESGKPAPAVMYFHGNAELIDQQDRIVEGYSKLGLSVFLPEYRGYGRSAGKPSEKEIGEDMIRFYDRLIRRPDVDPSRIVFHGRSVGGGVAADLATRRTPAALILESTFSSIAAMALKFGAPPFLLKHPFRTDRVVEGLDVPILIFHGTRDTVVPVSHGRRLHKLARGSTYVEYNSDHNDFPGEGNDEAYWREIQSFLIRPGVLSAPKPAPAAPQPPPAR